MASEEFSFLFDALRIPSNHHSVGDMDSGAVKPRGTHCDGRVPILPAWKTQRRSIYPSSQTVPISASGLLG